MTKDVALALLFVFLVTLAFVVTRDAAATALVAFVVLPLAFTVVGWVRRDT